MMPAEEIDEELSSDDVDENKDVEENDDVEENKDDKKKKIVWKPKLLSLVPKYFLSRHHYLY